MKKVSLLLLIIILHHSGAYSQNAPVLRDTIEHYVVERAVVDDNVIAKVYKAGTNPDKPYRSGQFKIDYNSNRNALWQLLGGQFDSNQLQDKVRKALCVHPGQYENMEKPGWLALSVTISVFLNIEYLLITHRGGTLRDLSANDCFAIYRAIEDPSLYHVWDEPVPYVQFDFWVQMHPEHQRKGLASQL